MNKLSFDGPIVLAVLDGVGLAPDADGNAVSKARTPFLGRAAREYLHVALNASGLSVGLVEGQMGNSEVGHNTMGSGQIIKQGIARINEAFSSGEVFSSEAWKGALTRVLHNNGSATLHFAGIFSDGGVHSDISHLFKMINRAYEEGVRRMRVHAVFDGRDVAPTSALEYIKKFEEFVSQFNDADIRLASGGGRMVCVADRYENDWNVVKSGFDMMRWGKAEYYFHSAEEGVVALRREHTDVQDQNLPPFVVVDADEKPVGLVKTGDALVYFDFRADRAIEIAQAFTYWDFPYFDRGNYSPDDVYFVGMTEYNSDTHVPEHRLVEPVIISETLNQFLGLHNLSQLAVSETVKFGHITYYFNGNSYEKTPGEEHVQIDSYTEPFETRPWMRTAEISDAVISNLEKYKFVRLNFPGGDMVGHTADINATIVAMEAIDLNLKRIYDKVRELGGCMIIVADHGNAEEMLDNEGRAKTAHTTNRVPCIICDDTINRSRYELAPVANPGLANLASTIATLFGFEDYPKSWNQPLIKTKN